MASELADGGRKGRTRQTGDFPPSTTSFWANLGSTLSYAANDPGYDSPNSYSNGGLNDNDSDGYDNAIANSFDDWMSPSFTDYEYPQPIEREIFDAETLPPSKGFG